MTQILAVNCGSSSIKFTLFSSPSSEKSTPTSPNSSFPILLSGSASSLSSDKPSFKLKSYLSNAQEPETISTLDSLTKDTSYLETFDLILSKIGEVLNSSGQGKGKNGLEGVEMVCHRIVHGGSEREPVVIKHGTREEEETIKRMEGVTGLAPLHNHHAMLIVKSTLHSLPSSLSILLFDTLFHLSLPAHITVYATPSPLNPSHIPPVPIRKYGFHGLSYSSILPQMSIYLSKPSKELNLIVAHLGSGGSICLIQNGKSMNTTMGLTPLEGLMGGTRSGSVDPSLVFHLGEEECEEVEWEGRKIRRGEMRLNKEGGFQAICGTSDFSKIVSERHSPNSPYALCYAHYLSQINSTISSYLSQLFSSSSPSPSLDALVFSGGIGEHSFELREDVLNSLLWMEKLAGGKGGVDKKRNEEGEGGRRITKEGSWLEGWMVETDEEGEMVKMGWGEVHGKE